MTRTTSSALPSISTLIFVIVALSGHRSPLRNQAAKDATGIPPILNDPHRAGSDGGGAQAASSSGTGPQSSNQALP